MNAPVVRSLFVPLDTGAREPLQVQLYTSIRRAILEGVLAPGARLPSSRALAADLGVSRTTTVLALEQLAAEGYLTAKSGSGTFVARELPDGPLGMPAATRRTQSRHPPLSSRGGALAMTPRTAVKLDGPPRAFRIGTPALDRFPIQVWATLASRRLRSLTLSQLDYADSSGIAPLREAIAGHVGRARGTSCTADQVIVVAGAQHGLELICRLLLDPGDEAWIEDPGYPGARAALVAAGARVRPIPVDAQGLDLEAAAQLGRRPRLVYVTPSHQFPLGVALSLGRRRSLLAYAKAARAWIVEDDYDSEFRYGVGPIPSLHGLDVDRRVIYVGSFSKTLFPALRLGYLIVPPDLREAVKAARRATDIHSPVFDQTVLADFINGGHFERHLRRMRIEYQARRDALAEAARRHGRGALTLRPVTTGLHAIADLTGADEGRVAEEARARGVEVMPLSAYRIARGSTGHSLVLGFAAIRPELLDAGMRQLAEAIDVAGRTEPRRVQGRR